VLGGLRSPVADRGPARAGAARGALARARRRDPRHRDRTRLASRRRPLQRLVRQRLPRRLAAAADRHRLPGRRRPALRRHRGRDRQRTAARRRAVPLRRAGRFRRAGNQLHHLHLLVHRRACGHRAGGGGAGDVRAAAGTAQPPGPAVGGSRVRRRRSLGQFPADLLARGPDHRRDAAVAQLAGGVVNRLVVVSNRVAVPGESRAGGLAVGLEAALRTHGGLWFGWSGKVVREASGRIHEQAEGDVRYVTMDLDRPDHDAYYNGFANRTLWPLLHSRLDLVDYARETRAGYRRVNLLFAEKLAPMLRDSDVLWIHDYHLISALPGHGRLFGTLYAYDLVGFQTVRDADRFRTYARIFGGGGVEPDGSVSLPGGRRMAVGTFPIGIDATRIATQSTAAVNK